MTGSRAGFVFVSAAFLGAAGKRCLATLWVSVRRFCQILPATFGEVIFLTSFGLEGLQEFFGVAPQEERDKSSCVLRHDGDVKRASSPVSMERHP